MPFYLVDKDGYTRSDACGDEISPKRQCLQTFGGLDYDQAFVDLTESQVIGLFEGFRNRGFRVRWADMLQQRGKKFTGH